MYSYYGLSVFPSMHKYLWWKKYLTQAQLVCPPSLLSALLHVKFLHIRMGWGKVTAIPAFLEGSGFVTGDRDAYFSLKRAY